MKKILAILSLFVSSIAFAQHQFTTYVTASGTDTYAVTISVPTITNYSTKRIHLRFANANTGSSTLNVTPSGASALGAVAIRAWDGDSWEALVGGEIVAGQDYVAVYNGTYFELYPSISGTANVGELENVPVSGTTYTVTDADAGKLILINNTGFTTITLPASISSDLVFNFRLDIDADSALFVGSGGAVLDAVSDTLKTPGQAASWVKINSTDYLGFGALGTSAGGGSGTTIVGDGNGTTGNSNASDMGGALNQNTTITGGGFSFSLGTSGSRLSTFTLEGTGNHLFKSSAGQLRFVAGDNYGFFSDLRMMRIYNGSQTPSFTGTNPNTALQLQAAFNNFGSGTELVSLLWLANSGTTFINNITTPVAGGVAFDSDQSRIRYYNGSAWKYLANTDDAGGGGGGQWYSLPPVTYTANHDLDFADTTKTIIMDVSGGDLELHVPEEATTDFNDGQIILILITGNNDLTIVEDGAASVTSTSGSLAVTGSTNPIYLTLQNVGGNDWVLSAPSAGGGGGDVSSVFGRTGAVVAVAGDYDGTEVTNTPAGNIASTTTQAAINELDTEKQPIDSDLTSWAGVTRATGFDTFTGNPTSANLRSLLTDESGTGSAYFQGGDIGTPSAGVGTNLTGIPQSGVTNLTTDLAAKWATTGTTNVTTPTINGKVTHTQSSESSTNTFFTLTQAAHTGGTPTGFLYTGGAHTGLAQAVESNDIRFDLSQTKQWTGGGTFPLQRSIRMIPATNSATSTTTITTAVTLGIRGPIAGTNMTHSKSAAIGVFDASDEMHVALSTNSSTSGALVLGAGGSTFAAQPSIGAASKTTGTGAASGTALRFFGDTQSATTGAFQFTQLNGNSQLLNGTASIFVNVSPSYLESSSAGAAHSVVRVGYSATHAGTTGNRLTAFLADPTYNFTNTNASTLEGFTYTPTVTALNSNSVNKAWRHNSGFVQWESVLSPAQITANQDDYNPTGLNNGGAPNGASIVRLSTDASRNITSIVGGVQGRLLVLVNVGSQNIVIKDDDGATGTAANRIQLNADITLLPEDSMMLWYDGTSSRWRSMK